MRKIFQDLSVKDSDKKLNAIKELLLVLDDSLSKNLEITLMQDLEDLQENLKYSLKRLIRGLASGRDDARLGFSMALTEVTSIPHSFLIISF